VPTPGVPLTPARVLSRLPRRLANIGGSFPIEFMGRLTGDTPTTPKAVETTGPRKLAAPEPPRPRPRPSAPAESPAPEPTITPWTEADITPDDAPATAPSEASPSKLRGIAGGFKSRAQWRKFFADPRLRRFAHSKAHASKGGPKVRYRVLPERKGPPTPGTLK
jgi:hypothetical protein